MAQPDPNPTSMPKAVSVLGYERQTDDRAAIWVVRFVGASIISFAAAALLSRAFQLYSDWASGFAWHGIRLDAELLTVLAFIPLGSAIVARRRLGFYGMLALLAFVPFSDVIPGISLMRFSDWLHALPQMLLTGAVFFAALLSVLRHAEASNELRPPRASQARTPTPANSLDLLTSRIGWVCLGCAASGAMSWQGYLADGRFVAYAVCGVLLCAKRRWALWPLAAILPLGLYAQLAQFWPATFLPQNLFRSSAWYAFTIIMQMGGLETALQVCLLCLLARKARQAA